MTDTQASPKGPVDRRMALAREWDDLVDRVRGLGGFEDFLLPPRLDSLLPAASGGPVVVVNVSRWRCDALIVTEQGVRSRVLPDLTLDRATEWANTYLEILHAAEQARLEHQLAHDAVGADPRPSAIRAQQRAAGALMAAEHRTDEMLAALQRQLWDSVAAPVLDELGLHGTTAPADGPWPRLWWCPTGPLTLLPLHTAGYHEAGPDETAPRTVLDRVVSSYTPTLRVLTEARAGRGAGGHADTDDTGAPEQERMLVVSVGDAPGQPRLHNAGTERDTLTQLFPARHTLLEGPGATRGAVEAELARHRWVHFSCHGDQDLAEPSRGGLMLHDGVLTVADLAARQFRGDFAGLSACKTAVGGVNLLDEAITLASALHYTGYRHVVAALWSVDDKTAGRVFGAVYRYMTVDGRLRSEAAAPALHRAVRALRREMPDQPRLWTPFTHIGP
ncbi:CHAT domain-containing protein [Streptomyces collinus]|uniref:CHAT domain-containing protein n=1 Tax=Streptomyces collinus TaxID=42684 RepID=UPI003316C634